MTTLLNLPNDILILICRELPLLDLYRLRQANYRLAALVKSNSRSICSWTAYRTFPQPEGLLKRAGPGPQDFEWLNRLILEYLAAVIVDRIRLDAFDLFSGDVGIPSEDDRSWPVRVKVVDGLLVFRTMSNISKDVHATVQCPRPSFKQRLKRYIRTKSFSAQETSAEILEWKEKLILERREMYLRSLKQEQILHFRFAYGLLHCLIKTKYDPPSAGILTQGGRVPPNFTGPDYFDWAEDERGQSFRRGESWVNWCLLHDGLRSFWLQWYGRLSPSFAKDFLLQEWERRNENQILIERNATIQLEMLLRSLDGGWSNLPFYLSAFIPEVDCDRFSEYVLQYRRGPPKPFAESTEDMRTIPHRILFRDDSDTDT